MYGAHEDRARVQLLRLLEEDLVVKGLLDSLREFHELPRVLERPSFRRSEVEGHRARGTRRRVLRSEGPEALEAAANA